MREKILETIISTLQLKDFVLALWQGGSAAHGYTDEWSDIDIVVTIDDSYVEETFTLVENALESIANISFKYTVPEPTWHGHSQCFYQLAGVSAFLAIDFAVIKRSSKNDFLDWERHGNLVVAFDKENIVVQTHLDVEEHFAKMGDRFKEIREQFDFGQMFLKKDINRGHLASAITSYHSLTLRNLVEVLGMIYRPYRYDFGMKYFYRDFPEQVVKRVELLFCVSDLEDLSHKQQVAVEMFAETVSAVEEALQNRR